MIRFFVLAAAVSVVMPAAEAQVAPPAGQPQATQTTIKATTQEVLLDMVFRDKKGRPVRDIRPEEIQVFDNGAPQKINSFRLIEGKAAAGQAGPAGQAGRPPLDPLREIRLVTLVFEGLDVDGKRFFRAATKDILEMAPEPNLYFSVFTVDQRLHCLQPFSADHKALQSGIDRAITFNSFTQNAAQSAQVKASLSQIIANPVVLQGSAQGGPSSAAVSGFVNYALAKMQYDMLEFAESADRQEAARASLLSLLNLVREQAKLPGRKVVLYFNPWFNVPEFLQEAFDSVVATANQSNVTFYCVDTKGLATFQNADSKGNSTTSAAGEGTRQLADAVRASKDQMTNRSGEVRRDQVKAFDTAQSGLRANPQLWLKDLAEKTGGFAIIDSNDWKSPLRRTLDEVRTYYEAAYSPQIETLDGAYRKIAVKVSRPDVTVHTRDGYFALAALKGGQQLLSFEMPLLNAMNAATPPSDIAFRAAAHRFNNRGPKLEYMLSVEVPMKGIAFQPDPAKKAATAHALLMAAVKDEQGEIVAKFSKDFPIKVDLDKLEAAKAGNLLQTFRAELPPGRYTLAGVVIDANGNKTAVKKTALAVPEPGSKLALSELVIVRRNDILKDSQLLDAFYYEGGKIVPMLDPLLKGGAGQQLPFYFAVYPDPSIPQAPELTMSFYLEGQLLGSASAPLGKPEKSGRIPYIASIPADAFAPGKYELRATINQGSAKAEERIQFTVE